MEIKNFSLTQLNNGDFYQFNENVVNASKLEPAVDSILLPFAS